MPIYDYECRSCGHREEVLHGVNAAGPTACASCGGPMRKLLSPPAIVFKGSGWAKKDARQSKPAPKSGAASDGAERGGGERTTASESSDRSESKAKPQPETGQKAGDSSATASGKQTSAAASD